MLGSLQFVDISGTGEFKVGHGSAQVQIQT